MKKLLFIIILISVVLAANCQQQTINNGETGLQVRTKLNTMFGELYGNVVNVQFSVDGLNNWHTTYATADRYMRISRDVGTSWGEAIPLFDQDFAADSSKYLMWSDTLGATKRVATVYDLSTIGSIIEQDGDSTNEIQAFELGVSGSVPYVLLTKNGGSFSVKGLGITAVSRSGDTLKITSTEVDGSVSNELQNLTATKAGNNVAINISDGSGAGFSVADADSSTTNEIELPAQTGNNGKYLKTNGTTVSWETVTGGTSQWTDDTNGITYANNVGIGAASQASNQLYVKDSIASNYAASITNNSANGLGLLVNTANTGNLGKIIRLNSATNEVFNVIADGTVTLKEHASASGTPDSGFGRFYIKSDGKAYFKNDAGTEYDLTAAGTSASAGGVSGDIQYNSGGSLAGFGDWNGSTLAVGAAVTGTTFTGSGNIISTGGSIAVTGTYPIGMQSGGYFNLSEVTAPGTPTTGIGYIYEKTDNKLYFKNDAGTEFDLTAASAGNGWTDNGSYLTLSTSTDYVGIGSAGSSSYKVSITPETSKSYGLAVSGETGSGAIYAENTKTGALTHGGAFITNGNGASYGVRGEVGSGTGGLSSKGVYGLNLSSTTSTHYGGYFTTTTGENGVGVYGSGDSIGVEGSGYVYDFYASGSGTNYGSPSSKRWKKNIFPIPDALKKVNQLSGVFFDWDEAHGGKHDVGLIAEEVGKVLPEVVDYEQNGVDAIGMDYSKITPLLLQAIKELSEQVEDLKAEVERLKKQSKKKTYVGTWGGNRVYKISD